MKKIKGKDIKNMSILIMFIFILYIRQGYLNNKINDDISIIYKSEKYSLAKEVKDVKLVKQKISCGYAIIEMLGGKIGKNISEELLFEENNGKISTSMGEGLKKELNKQFPEYDIRKYSNLKNSQMIDEIFNSLSKGMPVPAELAALYSDNGRKKWTLHFVLVVGIDVPNDEILLLNPYGYPERYTLIEFLDATRYDCYDDMEVYYRIGFLMGVFKKNTIYIIR